jgi:RimJ/RimL family protein N-acetyltransferase
MQNSISIAHVNAATAEALSDLLRDDKKLAEELGISQTMDPKTYLADIRRWQAKTNSESFAIILNKRAIGLISLSHQSGDEARVGYWLASIYWNKGYTSQAFDQILTHAKTKGFRIIRATIDPDNLASVAIWKNRKASLEMRGGKLEAQLDGLD